MVEMEDDLKCFMWYKCTIYVVWKFYCTNIRPTMLYEMKCLALKNQYENNISVTEMRMLCWVGDKSIQDTIRNDNLKRVWVAPIVKKKMETLLIWFVHVERRPVDSFVKSRSNEE
jgi:hypothetical protein